ncbi:MAG: hypothetical protein IJX34_03745 [Clostridia bacterium]|nr:hypothetical protein [Clostridia bacterium]
MKKTKFLALVMAMVMLVSNVSVFAATPETVDTTATINLAKVLNPSEGGVYPNEDTFEFVLEPVSFTPAATGVTSTDTTKMPAGETVTIKVAEDGDVKKGTESIELDFAGKEIGVYTYKLTETKGDVAGVEYDESVYYVNVYVINQVGDDKVPTGLVTVSDITAWRTNNMSDEALKALTKDWTGDLLDINKKDADGKVGNDGGDNEIDYPFENEYSTDADIIVSKTVTGNYASTTQEFAYTVALTGLVANAEYTATLADGSTKTITADANGEATLETTLAHGETFTIAGLPSSAAYTITETQDATYSGKYAVTDGSAAPASGEAGLGVDVTANGVLADNSMVDNILTDEEVDFTNNKEYTVPTGIALSVLPFACGIAVVAVLLVVTNKKRQED